MKKSIRGIGFLFLIVSVILCNVVSASAAVYENYPGIVSIAFDKNAANVGEIICASIKIENAPEFAGIQVNLKYDPTVLEAVDPVTGQAYPNSFNSILDGSFENKLRSDILLNNEYMPYEIAFFDKLSGTINATRSYTFLEKYRLGGIADTEGIAFKVGFRILKYQTTSICFEDCASMPGANRGTIIGTWNGDAILSGYEVIQPGSILQISPTPTPVDTSNGHVVLNMSKNKVQAGDIITGTLNINNLSDFAAIQANLKYDPAVLQPISLKTGAPYPGVIDNNNADLLFNESDIISKQEFRPFKMAFFDYTNGMINVSRCYTDIAAYRASNKAETTGTIVTIGFKALKNADVDVHFEKTPTMPGTDGLYLFNWYSKQIFLDKAPVVK